MSAYNTRSCYSVRSRRSLIALLYIQVSLCSALPYGFSSDSDRYPLCFDAATVNAQLCSSCSADKYGEEMQDMPLVDELWALYASFFCCYYHCLCRKEQNGQLRKPKSAHVSSAPRATINRNEQRYQAKVALDARHRRDAAALDRDNAPVDVKVRNELNTLARA